jgi:hypothetical protein
VPFLARLCGGLKTWPYQPSWLSLREIREKVFLVERISEFLFQDGPNFGYLELLYGNRRAKGPKRT